MQPTPRNAPAVGLQQHDQDRDRAGHEAENSKRASPLLVVPDFRYRGPLKLLTALDDLATGSEIQVHILRCLTLLSKHPP